MMVVGLDPGAGEAPQWLEGQVRLAWMQRKSVGALNRQALGHGWAMMFRRRALQLRQRGKR
jgi:hypothetical protein